MRRVIAVMGRGLLLAMLLVAGSVFGLSAREIRIPQEARLWGQVVIAEWFYQVVHQVPHDVMQARTFEAWPGRDDPVPASDDFDVRIEAHPGDVLVLEPGQYTADLFVYTPNITIRTDPKSSGNASIWGTIEVDSTGVTLDHLIVTGPRKCVGNACSSGHGIEVNRLFVRSITIRNVRVEDRDWVGIHVIGPNGQMSLVQIENCELVHNGMDGMDAQSTDRLVITGSTITDNGWDNAQGVGVRIGMNVGQVEMTGNVIERNRYQNVFRRE